MKLNQEMLERNIGWMIVCIVLLVSVGGLVEIVPLYFQKSTTEPVKGVTPYSADHPEVYRQRSGGIILPEGADWLATTEDLRKAYVEHPELNPAVAGRRTPEWRRSCRRRRYRCAPRRC